jgi:hypothetical protein
MAMENYTRHQQNIIRNYYENRENVSFQRVQELLTDLYLVEGKKRDKVWESLINHLEKMGVPKDQVEHINKQRNPELVAKLIQSKV